MALSLDSVNALAGFGSAVAVFPVKRVNESLALGFVMSRMVEAAVIMIGVVALLAVVTVHQDYADTTSASTLATAGHSLVATRDWTFLFGTLLYRSRLVPRAIPTIGLVGAPLLFTANMLTLFGHVTQGQGWSMVATVPIATWELSVGFYMTFKGFKPTPYTRVTA